MNTDQLTTTIIALAVVAGFFGLVLTVLLGFVDVTEPTLAKLVGMMFGYVAAVLNPIIYKYFGQSPTAPPTMGE